MDYIVKVYKDWKFHSQFHEIVPDMDDEYAFNEKQSIRESSQPLRKYGSTSYNHNLKNNETLIRHEVEKSDTLQGIALRYGCTTEQLRRVNRLYASDSLFLRQILLVPVDKSSSYLSNGSYNENNSIYSNKSTENNNCGDPLNRTLSSLSSTSASSSSTSTENFAHPAMLPVRPFSIAGEFSPQNTIDHNSIRLTTRTTDNSKQSKSLDSMSSIAATEDENRRCLNEFLSKVDNTISASRKYVEKSKEILASSAALQNDTYPTNGIHRSHRNQQMPQHLRHSSAGSHSDTMLLLNTTQLRRVQTSLKRLEKQQDEFFEL